MRTRTLSLGVAAGALLLSQSARANELTCDKTVNGTTYLELSSYPATLTYEFAIHNASPDYSSTVYGAVDSLLSPLGFTFDNPPIPFTLSVGESATDTFAVDVADEQACLELAAADGTADDRIDNVLTVSWNYGEDSCTASVVCKTAPPPPPPEGGATRTPGFYKTHLDALNACIAALPFPIDLASALGLLWGSPAVYGSTGEHRSEIDQARFLLARHLLVAACNTYLFGTEPDPSTLLGDALSALSGNDCTEMHALAEALDDFNNSGDKEPFPAGFDPGPATPKDAEALAVDPVGPSGDQCI